MKKTPDETLKAFGMDPRRVMEQRKEKVAAYHTAAFDGVGNIVTKTLDLCEKQGFGAAGKLRVLQGIIEPGLFAAAICASHKPDIEKAPRDLIPWDSVLFTALLCAACTDHVTGKPAICNEHGVEAAHQMFEKVTGRVFRDCFQHTCHCRLCAARRKQTGVKLEPEADEGGL